MFDRYKISPEGLGEINIVDDENGEWVKYEDIKHLLERSDNSDYAKCISEIESLMMYRGSLPEEGKLEAILNKHFA